MRKKAGYKSSVLTRSEVPQEEASRSISFPEGVIALEGQEQWTHTATFFSGSHALIPAFEQ